MKKKILIINKYCGQGSTGRICFELAKKYEENGDTVKIAYGRGEVPTECRKYSYRIGNKLNNYIHGIEARMFDHDGFGSKNATREFIRWAETFNPDIVWLHNLHGYYINVEILFTWLKTKPNISVMWTLHDCWAFTGHCAYFTAANCKEWETQCHNCCQLKSYPACYLKGDVANNYNRKMRAFTGVKDMTIIVPSIWLKNLVKKSFLKDYRVDVIYNTIDKNVFKPTKSDFKEKYNLENKKIVLGVANVWDKRKGLEDFYELATMLDDHYAIVLVGLNGKQIHNLPKNILGLRRLNSSSELAGIYTVADYFVNPSKEETFGMTSLEAKSCGTETIVYEGTACEEIMKIHNGIIVPHGASYIYEAITGKKWGGVKNKGTIIVCIRKTNSTSELAKIYSAADWFVNPTYEDNYPTVNLEAISCGTTVITYNTGGCIETIQKS